MENFEKVRVGSPFLFFFFSFFFLLRKSSVMIGYLLPIHLVEGLGCGFACEKESAGVREIGEFLIRVCFVIKKMWINTMLLLLILFACLCVCTYEPPCLMCAKLVGEMGLLFEFYFVDAGKKW